MTRADSWGPIKARERDPGRTVVYALPTEIVFGSDEVRTLGRRLAEMGLRRPLVVTAERGRILLRLAGRIREKQEEGARLETLDCGKPHS